MRFLNRKQQRQLVCGFKVCSRVLNYIVIGQYTINSPEIFQVFQFSEFDGLQCINHNKVMRNMMMKELDVLRRLPQTTNLNSYVVQKRISFQYHAHQLQL